MQNTSLFDTKVSIKHLVCAFSRETPESLLTILDDSKAVIYCPPHRNFCCKNCSNINWVWEMIIKWGIMNYENFTLFLKTQVHSQQQGLVILLFKLYVLSPCWLTSGLIDRLLFIGSRDRNVLIPLSLIVSHRSSTSQDQITGSIVQLKITLLTSSLEAFLHLN